MKKSVDLLKHSPPDFNVFEKAGAGYLYYAQEGIRQILGGFAKEASHAPEFTGLGTFFDWPKEVKGYFSEDLIDIYAGWAKASDMLALLKKMPEEERKKHLELDKRLHGLDYTEVIKEFTDYAMKIVALELERSEQYELVLDGLLQRRIKDWESHLEHVAKYGFDSIEPTYDDYEVCEERSALEFAKTGIARAKKEYRAEVSSPRLRGLKYFNKFMERLSASNDEFRKITRSQACYEPWANEFFWWHRPPFGIPKYEASWSPPPVPFDGRWIDLKKA